MLLIIFCARTCARPRLHEPTAEVFRGCWPQVTSSTRALPLAAPALWVLQPRPYLLMCHIEDTCQGYQLSGHKPRKSPHSPSSLWRRGDAPWCGRVRRVLVYACRLFASGAKRGKLDPTGRSKLLLANILLRKSLTSHR